MSAKHGRTDQQSSFARLECVKREDAKRRFRETTAGERIESVLRISGLAAEFRSGVRTQR